jgi:hypothetical protein
MIESVDIISNERGISAKNSSKKSSKIPKGKS